MKSTLVAIDDVLVTSAELLVPAPREAEPAPTTVRGWLNRFSRMAPDQIATLLHTEKVKGTPRDAHACAFTVFFKQVLGHSHVHVCGNCVHIGSVKREALPLPASCRAFVKAFDAGRYPELYPELYRATMMQWVQLDNAPVTILYSGENLAAQYAKFRAQLDALMDTLAESYRVAPATLAVV